MILSYGSIFRVIDHLYGKFTCEVTSEFPSQGTLVFFDVSPHTQSNNQTIQRPVLWDYMASRWHHCNGDSSIYICLGKVVTKQSGGRWNISLLNNMWRHFNGSHKLFILSQLSFCNPSHCLISKRDCESLLIIRKPLMSMPLCLLRLDDSIQTGLTRFHSHICVRKLDHHWIS